MLKDPFVPVPSPFGTPGWNDERATQNAFVDYVGGAARADQLGRVFKDYPNEVDARPAAQRQGFCDEDVDAFLML